MNEDIIDALEATAGNRKARGRLGDPVVSDRMDIIHWRNHLLLFLESLDGDYTVTDIRETLENYD